MGLRGLTTYLLVAFAWSWSLEFYTALAITHSASTGITPSPYVQLTALIAMAGPLLGTLAAAVVEGESFRRLAGLERISAKWIPIAIAITLAWLAVALAFAAPLGLANPADVLRELRGVSVPGGTLTLIAAGLLAGVTVNAAAALMEEVGWRGYLYHEMVEVRGLGLAVAAALIGVVWGLWHAPLILLVGYNFPVSRAAGVLIFTLFCVAATYALLWLRAASGSTVPCAVLHGTFNGVAGVALLAAATQPDWLRPPAGLIGVAAWLVIDFTLYLAYSHYALLTRGRRLPLSL